MSHGTHLNDSCTKNTCGGDTHTSAYNARIRHYTHTNHTRTKGHKEFVITHIQMRITHEFMRIMQEFMRYTHEFARITHEIIRITHKFVITHI